MQYYSIDIQQDPACNANININIRPICGGRARIRATSQSSSTGGCVRSFSVLLFVEDTFPQWLHALSE
jgi:hypothetical protein